MQITVGIDEVGRGCLAGPVVACAVILPNSITNENIIDSKKLTEKKRNSIYKFLLANSIDYGLGIVCNKIIDKCNILNATKQAMHIALSKLKNKYTHIVIDAVKLNNLSVTNEHPFKAEDKFIQVAAASIIAKVYRDQLMINLHYQFPEYNWYKNKGYGTKEHLDAIKKFGSTYLHRKSFIKNYEKQR
jgi:ribonuclease HII